VTFLALGWTGCTAAAFWAGLRWSEGNASPADRTRRAALAQAALAAGDSHGAAAGRGTGQNSPAADGGPVSRAKPIRELTIDETKARVKDILAMEDPLARMEAYLEFIKGVQGDEQIAAAMESLTENYSGRERGREFSMFMTRWAKESPEAALAWTQKYGDWRSQAGAQTALAIWAHTDPDKAIEWALAHPPKDKDDGNHHLVAAISGIAKFDVDRASLLAQGMERSEARGGAMERVLDEAFKQRGDEAAKSMVMTLPEGAYRNNMLGRLAERLADKDAKSAAVWAASLPESEAKPRVVSEVIDEWADNNPNDAGTWLNGLPRTAAMDEPRERFAFKVQERDPEAAIAWAGTITNEKRRTETSYRLVREWMSREPDNARAWVGASQLPADMKERLLRRRG